MRAGKRGQVLKLLVEMVVNQDLGPRTHQPGVVIDFFRLPTGGWEKRKKVNTIFCSSCKNFFESKNSIYLVNNLFKTNKMIKIMYWFEKSVYYFVIINYN